MRPLCARMAVSGGCSNSMERTGRGAGQAAWCRSRTCPAPTQSRCLSLIHISLYSEERDKTSDLYIEHLIEQAMLYDSTPTVVAEVQVDFGEYVPEAFVQWA